METNKVGNISEAVIMQKFIELGVQVSIPFGDAKYDLVIDIKGKLYKVQIKSMNHQKDGILKLPTTQGHKHKGNLRSYKGHVDFISGYCRETGHTVLIPIEEVIEPGMRFRYKKAKNGQTKNLSLSIDNYLFDEQINAVVA